MCEYICEDCNAEYSDECPECEGLIITIQERDRRLKSNAQDDDRKDREIGL